MSLQTKDIFVLKVERDDGREYIEKDEEGAHQKYVVIPPCYNNGSPYSNGSHRNGS